MLYIRYMYKRHMDIKTTSPMRVLCQCLCAWLHSLFHTYLKICFQEYFISLLGKISLQFMQKFIRDILSKESISYFLGIHFLIIVVDCASFVQDVFYAWTMIFFLWSITFQAEWNMTVVSEFLTECYKR